MSSKTPQESIQPFSVSRDEAISNAPRHAVPSRNTRAGHSVTNSSGTLLYFVLAIALMIAAVAWAWQFQSSLNEAQLEAKNVSARVASLEVLLSDTDESVEKSSTALGAKLKVVDVETRRLEQRRREMAGELDELKKTGVAQKAVLKKLETTIAGQGKSVATMASHLASLNKMTNDLEYLAKTGKEIQVNMERLADSVNKANLERASLNKRVSDSEEWIDSINAFRKQVNTSINRLELEIRTSGPVSVERPVGR